MRVKDLLGYHVGGSVSEIDKIFDYIQEGVRTFQIHLSNPRRWEEPSIEQFRSILGYMAQDTNSYNIVVHGPFGLSVCKDYKSKHFQYGVLYYRKIIKLLNEISWKESDRLYIVSHVGSRDEEVKSVDTVIRYMQQFAYKINNDNERVMLTFENDAGSKKGTRVGSLRILEKLCFEGKCGNMFGITYDTEHAYANGYNPDVHLMKEFLSRCVKVVHLNSIPENVERGGHLDRHSDTLIKEGKESEYLLEVAKACVELNIPMILERNKQMMIEDRKWVLERVSDLHGK